MSSLEKTTAAFGPMASHVLWTTVMKPSCEENERTGMVLPSGLCNVG